MHLYPPPEYTEARHQGNPSSITCPHRHVDQGSQDRKHNAGRWPSLGSPQNYTSMAAPYPVSKKPIDCVSTNAGTPLGPNAFLRLESSSIHTWSHVAWLEHPFFLPNNRASASAGRKGDFLLFHQKRVGKVHGVQGQYTYNNPPFLDPVQEQLHLQV